MGHKTIQKNLIFNTLFLKFFMVKDICKADFFCFLLIFLLRIFNVEKIIKKFQTPISGSNVGNKGNKCFPTALHCTALHYITLHFLHCTALHYTALSALLFPKKNLCIQEALNLLTCEENNTDSKIVFITFN